MSKAFRTSRLMGLFALMLGAMAFSATAAQAELGAHWNVKGEEFKLGSDPEKLLKVQVQVNGIEELPATKIKEGILLTTSGGSKVEIHCTGIQFIDALLKELGSATGRIHFSGCTTKLNGGAAGVCKPHSPGAAEGLIETNALDGLIKLHKVSETEKVDLFELLPSSGSIFVTLILGAEDPKENECAIGQKFDVTGKAFLKDGEKAGLKEQLTHLFQEGPLSELFFGGNAATIDGSAIAELTGAHSAMNWSGIAA